MSFTQTFFNALTLPDVVADGRKTNLSAALEAN